VATRRRVFGPKSDEVTRECRKIHNEELNDLYCSPNIVRVIKSRRMRWVGNVGRMGERREAYTGFWWGNLRERDHLEDPGVDGRIILRRIFKKWKGGMDWTDLAQDRDRWRALVNVVINFRVPQNTGNFVTAENRLVSEEGLCSME
jgi:hypothetical protein